MAVVDGVRAVPKHGAGVAIELSVNATTTKRAKPKTASGLAAIGLKPTLRTASLNERILIKTRVNVASRVGKIDGAAKTQPRKSYRMQPLLKQKPSRPYRQKKGNRLPKRWPIASGNPSVIVTANENPKQKKPDPWSPLQPSSFKRRQSR
jgi:hypothetical protein